MKPVGRGGSALSGRRASVMQRIHFKCLSHPFEGALGLDGCALFYVGVFLEGSILLLIEPASAYAFDVRHAFIGLGT